MRAHIISLTLHALHKGLKIRQKAVSIKNRWGIIFNRYF